MVVSSASRLLRTNLAVSKLEIGDLRVLSYIEYRHIECLTLLICWQNMWQYLGGVVVIGGDGILYEVINGLMERPDWESLFPELKLGIIPCGSGNGLAKSISYAFR